MAALPSTSSSEPAVMEQVITDVFAKTVHTILESRSPNVSALNCNADPCDPSSSSSFSSNFRSWDRFFSFDHGPLILDVILCRKKAAENPGCSSPAGIFVRSLSSERDELGRRNTEEKIVERWILQCEREDGRGFHQSSEFQVSFRKASKKIIVLLRSLYSAVRLLPAYKLFRDLTASGKIYSISLSHRFSSFAEPFSREEDSERSQLDFGPVDIFSSKFSLSVAYLKKTLENLSSEPSNCMSSELIMDYVGSPLADPHRWFPSRAVSGSAPSYAAFCRQHSCCNLNPVLQHLQCLHQNVASSSSITCVSSPSSSSSATPSRLYVRSESAPGSITLFRHEGSVVGQNQCLSASSCPSRKSRECSSHADVFGAQVNITSAPKTLPLKKQLQFEKESLRFREFQTGKLLSKVLINTTWP
ncbi:hypothetical protein KSP40_PGU021726 [Platanthera guangdongensis]|uniref:Autophagy-related protein 13 N-terminal domain-containing protein n=1 Tax=Platanthera guangdongensis TaxID=2320717 RepID=A0ABR2M3Q6_9ASPA